MSDIGSLLGITYLDMWSQPLRQLTFTRPHMHRGIIEFKSELFPKETGH
jgi:hypothetical protein